MPDYVEYFLNSKSNIVQLETIEISHPDFSEIHRIVRNKTDGLTATLETETEVTFDYYPLRISQSDTTDDLDYSIRVDVGDLGELLPTELDAVYEASGFATRPTFKYRVYRSDDLSEPLLGPIELEIVSLAFSRTGVSFEARAHRLSSSSTGEVYSISRFPALRSLI